MNAAFLFELSRDRSVEIFEANIKLSIIVTIYISSPRIVADLVFLSTLFFPFPPSLGCASVGGNCFESFPSGDNENESKLKSKKLAGVNSNSISFQLEKQVEACLERTSMEELQLRNEVARCKTIKKGPPLLPRDEPRLPLFYEHSRERVCVEWDRVRTTTLYKSKS